VASGADVPFTSVGPASGFTLFDTTGVVVAATGTYLIDFSVSGVEPNQFALFDNQVPVAGSTYGASAGTEQNNGQVIVHLTSGSLLTLENVTFTAVDLQTMAGGLETSVDASIVIQQLG
jgi:hypothetical protein